MKVAIYIRKSREDKDEYKEDTLLRHERLLKEYCNKYDLRYSEKTIYREIVSGDSINNRPEMQRLLKDVENGLYDGVVVVELQRLSRGNGIDQEIIKETFRKSGTIIYTLNKAYDLSSGDELDEDMLELSLFLSRQELKAIKRRMIRGKKQAQKEGYYTGATIPFGYNKEKQNKGYVLVPNEKEAPIVQMLYNKYAYEGVNIAELVDYLNDNGIRTRKGLLWQPTLLRRLLKNKINIGYINSTTNGVTTHFKGKHQPLIDEETYNRVLEKFNQNAPKVKSDNILKNPLATFLRCGGCGKVMNMKFKCKTTNKPAMLDCKNKYCSNKGAYFHFVEKKLIEELEEELKNFNYFLENTADETRKIKETKEKEKAFIKSNIEKKKAMIDRCCEMLEEGIYSKDRYLERVQAIEEDLKALNLKFEELSVIEVDEEERVKSAIPILEKVLKEYWNLDAVDKNTLLKTIIERVEYTKTKRKSYKEEIDNNFELKIFLKI